MTSTAASLELVNGNINQWSTTLCLKKKTSKIIFVITTSNFHQIW